MMALGAAGRALIQGFEKCRLTAYPDSKGVPTIGWGHTGPDVCLGTTCTQEQADAWFVQDTQKAVNGVNRSLDIQVTQNQFDALVAFTFNVGVTAEGHSTLHSLVNQSDFAGAALEFGKWNHSGGQVVAGLTARRAAEKALFLTA